ncbi:MAG TPA: hypothetical protein VE131_06640 [Terriglobales bacterium]|nr:hypothetical protein [Terriglobales bacterium]
MSVTSFCLNCSYKLPVRAVVHGARRVSPLIRRRRLHVAEPGPRSDLARSTASTKEGLNESRESSICPEDYSRHLRAIGQCLERRRFATFNLECTDSTYWIRLRDEATDLRHRLLAPLKRDRSQPWLKVGNHLCARQGLLHPGAATLPIKFSLQDVEYFDRLGKHQRLQTSGLTDGHRLSQLLRTLGALVSQRNHRLLAISWRDLSICTVVETAQGKREIDVFRLDNLYDLWVRMYLKRENRVLSDVPY